MHSVLYFTTDHRISCVVSKESPSKVMFEGQELSLSRAALEVLKKMHYQWSSARGSDFWEYEGETLTGRCFRMEI